METKWRKVTFEEMLKSDSRIICEDPLLSNSKVNYGVDLTQPMFFDTFLHQVGTHYGPMNCKRILEQARWYIVDEGL